MMGLRVTKTGVLATIQDLGRTGSMAMGITQGGVMDEHAARWANHLLTNPSNAPVIEITLGNMAFEVEQPTWFAVTGADMPLSINGKTVAQWQTHFVEAGDSIELGWSRSGLRAYLAVYGGFDIATEFGSVATVLREGMGGLDGQALKQGDQLPYQPANADLFELERSIASHFVPNYEAPLEARVVCGYQFESFSQDNQQRFFNTEYTVANESDRMGYRLDGEALTSPPEGMLSEGIAYGAIQVPPNGCPIVLLKDRQTLGGYPKLGSVLPLDCFQLSQRRPGQAIRFVPIEIDEAQQLMKTFYQFFS